MEFDMTNATNVRGIPCEWCGEEFEPRNRRAKYCGRSCGNKAYTVRNAKPCSVPGCNVVARARGICSTHYNRMFYTKEQRHKTVMTQCTVCDAPISRREDDRYQHVCSTACRTILEWGAEERRRSERDRASVLLKRARALGAEIVDVFDPFEIFERDSWTCYLCGVQCEEYGDICNPRSATIDHVVALSKGGNHSRANAKTACLGCNSSKSTGDAPREAVRPTV